MTTPKSNPVVTTDDNRSIVSKEKVSYINDKNTVSLLNKQMFSS
jgi:hypothetical protein